PRTWAGAAHRCAVRRRRAPGTVERTGRQDLGRHPHRPPSPGRRRDSCLAGHDHKGGSVTSDRGAVLHTVRATTPLTAAAAVAWFAACTPTGSDVIGYLFAARRAAWVRVRPDGQVEGADAVTDLLTEAYELVLFDGRRELRWLHTSDDKGTAVALGE